MMPFSGNEVSRCDHQQPPACSMILLAIGVYHGLANRSEQKTKESAAINPNPTYGTGQQWTTMLNLFRATRSGKEMPPAAPGK